MLYRWDTKVNDLNFALQEVKRLTKKLIRKKQGGRGRPPKHDPVRYAQLLAIKEFCNALSLRKVEVRISNFVVGERVDHSVIAYWENKEEMINCLKILISRAGKLLNKRCNKSFTFIDSTKFTSWKNETIEIHVCNRITKETIYPIGISFKTNNVRDPVDEAVPPGEGKLYGDAWYDENKAIGILFQKGYIPIICPNKRRSRGYWRKKARELYNRWENRLGYRHRSRGESMFGSLTNEFGDRFKAINENSMDVRILARIFSYQIKLLIRLEGKIINIEVLIIRHARGKSKIEKLYPTSSKPGNKSLKNIFSFIYI
jgi:hypothetical protein